MESVSQANIPVLTTIKKHIVIKPEFLVKKLFLPHIKEVIKNFQGQYHEETKSIILEINENYNISDTYISQADSKIIIIASIEALIFKPMVNDKIDVVITEVKNTHCISKPVDKRYGNSLQIFVVVNACSLKPGNIVKVVHTRVAIREKRYDCISQII